jgi:hypothetical protein
MNQSTIRTIRREWVLAVGMLAWTTIPSRLVAQINRDSLVAAALEEFDTDRRLQLLRPALDPAAGPLTESWRTGVQLMAQTLLEDRRDSLASVWLRWAARQAPDFEPDTIQFLPSVAASLRAARDFTRQTGTQGDSLAGTSWVWPAVDDTNPMGRLQVSAPGVQAPLRAVAVGVGEVSGDSATELAPGSYEIHASAAGYDSLVVTREVLPATRTVLELRPRPLLAQAAPTPAPAPMPPPIPVASTKPRKKFPWLVVAGVAAVGVGVAALAGGGGDGGGQPHPTTGGITIDFPNP